MWAPRASQRRSTTGSLAAGKMCPLVVADALQVGGQPRTGAGVEGRGGQVSPVLRAIQARLIEQRDLGPQVADAIDGLQGARPGHPDRGVALEHPLLIACVELEVQSPRMLGVTAHPELLASRAQRLAGEYRAQRPVVGLPQMPVGEGFAQLIEVKDVTEDAELAARGHDPDPRPAGNNQQRPLALRGVESWQAGQTQVHLRARRLRRRCTGRCPSHPGGPRRACAGPSRALAARRA